MKNLKKLENKEVKTTKTVKGGGGGRQIDDLIINIGGPMVWPSNP
jgi:hypothetical protein